MKMDRVDKIISMISDVVVNTYNSGEPLFTNHSTSLSVDKDDALKKVEQNTSNPMSFRGFIKRMQTYNIVCWYAHRWLALQLARRGWENVKDCVVKCCFCAAELDLGAHLISTPEENLLKKLSKHHASFCRWQTMTSPEFFACVPYVQSSQGLKITVTRIASLLLELGQELPKIPEIVLHKMQLDSKTLELLICGLLKDVSVSDASVSAVVLTLCGWSPASTTGVLCCCYCDRRIALRHWMSVQEFNEQRCLVLNDSNKMKLCSTSYVQSSFASGADEEEEGSQSSLSDQSIITEVTDEDEEVEEEEEDEEEQECEEMEVEDYEIYEKETEEQDCVSAENDELYDDKSSKINSDQNKVSRENNYEKFQSHKYVDDVEMEEHYDELDEQDLEENNFDEEDNINDDTEDELQQNEDGPSDEDIQEAEISDGSVSDNVEFKSRKLKDSHKQTQCENDDAKQNYEYSSAVENQYDSCANEDDIESSEEDDVIEENEGEEEEVEEEEEDDENENEQEVEEIGDEDDDDDDDDDDDGDEDEVDDDEDEDEMLDDCKSQENDSDKVIELSDSDEEITPQPKETTHTFPNPASVLVVKTQTVVKSDGVIEGNEPSNCEKLINEDEAEFEAESQKSNNDSMLSEDVEMQSQFLSNPRQLLNCENQDINTVPLVEEINNEDSTFKGESQDDSKVIDQQEKCTLKRKRDDDDDDYDSADDENGQLNKKKQLSSDESELNGSGKVIIGGDTEDKRNNMSEGESICSEAPDKNVETSCSAACSNDDDGDDDSKSAVCEISMVEQIVECEEKHPNSPHVSETKFDCVVRSSEGGGNTPDTKNLGKNDVESTGTLHLTPFVSEVVSEAPAGAKEEPIPSPATSRSEVDSELVVSENDAISSCDNKPAVLEQSENTVEKGSICMPVLSLEVQPEDGHVAVQKSGGVVDDAVGNMPILVREDTLGDVCQEQPGAVTSNDGSHDTLAAVQVVQNEHGEGVQVQIPGEVNNDDRVRPSQQPPGVGEVLVASEKVQSSLGGNGSKEDCSIDEVNCLVESTSVQNHKSSESEPVSQITEDIKATATIDNIDDRLSGVLPCLPMEENAHSETSAPKVLDNDQDKCASSNCEGSVNEDGVVKICEVEDMTACAEQDEVTVHEVMDIGEAGEEMARRGVKRDRDSDSEQSSPAAKRPHQSTEVQKQVPLLDPTSEHRFWCLWSASISTSPYRHKSGCEIVFQEILEKIVQQRKEQDYMDIAGKLRHTQEQITPL